MLELLSKLKLAIIFTPVILALPVSASIIRADITVVGPGSAAFASPIVTFTNLSDAGYQITRTDISAAFSDYILYIPGNPIDDVFGPAGGTYTPLGNTQLSATDVNDGCNAQTFSLTSFDPSDTFTYRFDPENNACQSIVVDFRSRMSTTNQAVVTVDFAGPGITGVQTLTGSTWAKELINPAAADTVGNERFRLTVTANVTDPAPEPAAMVLLGSGLAVLGMRRRRAA